MANKGNSGYIKRLNAPKYFSIHRKEHRYIIRQNPGRHTLQRSVALTLILERLGLASTRGESGRIIKEGKVKVNGQIIKNPKYPVGLNDVIVTVEGSHIVGINERGQIAVHNYEKGAKQLYKVVGKYKYSGNKIMLRLHDGSSVNGDDNVNVNDSVAIDNMKVVETVKLGSGSRCEVIDGVHVGKSGTIKGIMEGNMHKAKSVMIEVKGGTGFETLVKNIIVVG